jgi:chemotaxis family two-component system sensor kinase Cph1
MIAEIMTGVAYLGIPVLLFVLWRKRPQLIPSQSALWGFIGFIAFCGAGHFIDAIVWEYPAYRLWLVSRWATGLTSMTVLLMLPVVYRQLKRYRSSGEYHEMANVAHLERLRAEGLKAKAEKRAATMERELSLLLERIDHLHWREETIAEAEVLRHQVQRVLQANRVA